MTTETTQADTRDRPQSGTEASLEEQRARKQVPPRAFREDSGLLTPDFSPEDAFLDSKRRSALSH